MVSALLEKARTVSDRFFAVVALDILQMMLIERHMVRLRIKERS